MTDFDSRLRERLERLDAAVPEPFLPAPSILAADRPRPARRRLILLLAAAAVLALASAATASRILFPDVPQPPLDTMLIEVFEGRDCVTAIEARPEIRTRLDALGYADWAIEARPGAEEGRCVHAGYLTPEHVVILFPFVGVDAVEAIKVVGAELLVRCLNLADARELLSSALISMGIHDFDIRTDGPHAAPIGEEEAYRARVATGCVLFSAIGGDAAGRPTLYLWAP